MTDLNPLTDPDATPEDVATLYSWANLHGAKYRDFSAARAQTREKVRLRAEQANEEEKRLSQAESQAAQGAEEERAAEEANLDEQARDGLAREEKARQDLALHEQARQAESALRQAEQLANAQQAARQAAERATEQAAQQLAQQRAWQPPGRPVFSPAANPAQPTFLQQALKTDADDSARPAAFRLLANQYSGRPAWLTSDDQETAVPFLAPSVLPPPMPSVVPKPIATPRTSQDSQPGPHDRLTSRWFALRGVFDGSAAEAEMLPLPVVLRTPSMAVFSLAGGVGKTCLVATLGRALSARGERVLLVDMAAFGLLPFFFGATDQRPGLLRTFTPPGGSSDAPVQMVTIDPEGLNTEPAGQQSLSGEIANFALGASRVIVDLATASGATTRRIMRMSPMVLVPVIADMNSVVSVSSIDAFFEHNSGPAGQPVQPYYILNQFDASLPLHLDVREVLREQLGERLLPFVLRRAAAMSEALAEGMTVMDYAPGSPLAEDFNTLAGWVKSLSAPAATSYRGVRWSER